MCFEIRSLRLSLTKHKCLTAAAGGSGHGHSTEAELVHDNWAVFYAFDGFMSRGEFKKSTQTGTLSKLMTKNH
jgi:hypothetical protein